MRRVSTIGLVLLTALACLVSRSPGEELPDASAPPPETEILPVAFHQFWPLIQNLTGAPADPFQRLLPPPMDGNPEIAPAIGRVRAILSPGAELAISKQQGFAVSGSHEDSLVRLFEAGGLPPPLGLFNANGSVQDIAFDPRTGGLYLLTYQGGGMAAGIQKFDVEVGLSHVVDVETELGAQLAISPRGEFAVSFGMLSDEVRFFTEAGLAVEGPAGKLTANAPVQDIKYDPATGVFYVLTPEGRGLEAGVQLRTPELGLQHFVSTPVEEGANFSVDLCGGFAVTPSASTPILKFFDFNGQPLPMSLQIPGPVASGPRIRPVQLLDDSSDSQVKLLQNWSAAGPPVVPVADEGDGAGGGGGPAILDLAHDPLTGELHLLTTAGGGLPAGIQVVTSNLGLANVVPFDEPSNVAPASNNATGPNQLAYTNQPGSISGSPLGSGGGPSSMFPGAPFSIGNPGGGGGIGAVAGNGGGGGGGGGHGSGGGKKTGGGGTGGAGGSGGGSGSGGGGGGSPSPVPEPATAVLLLLGAGAWYCRQRMCRI